MPVASNRSRPAAAAATAPAAAGATPSLAGLRPEQLAFLGEYASTGQGKQIFVQLVCWPTVPAAWGMLAQAHEVLKNMRGDMGRLATAKGESWIHQVAPRLSQPLERDAAAAESTLATLLRRLPIRFAAAVAEGGANQSSAPATLRYRELFTESLGAYSTYLKSSNQAACRVLMAAEQTPSDADTRQQIYGDVLPHLDSAARVEGMALATWPGGDVPLALEMAQLAAFALGRHLQEPTVSSPLFDTVRGQLVPSSRFHSHSSSRRRR